MKTYVAKPGEIEQQWWVMDADGAVVGRLAAEIATLLMGKHRPTYTPHVDTGDFVVVINAEKIRFTGKKWEQKRYTWYSGYPGLKSESAGERLERRPELIITEAVRRMLPSLVSQLVVLLKDTSLGFIIGYAELLRRVQTNTQFFGQRYWFQFFVVGAAIYIAINFALSRLAVWLERRGGKKAAAPAPAAPAAEAAPAVKGKKARRAQA